MSEPVRDIGSTLRQARDRRALPLQECSDGTRIRSKYLVALEENRFDALPEPAYARGFLRTYAAFLGLDPGRLLDLFDEQGMRSDQSPAATLQLEAREPPLQAGKQSGSGGERRIGIPLALILVGAMIAVAIVYLIGTRLV